MTTVTIDNIKIGKKTYKAISDPVYANHIGNDFEPETCNLICCFAEDGGACLDIGANIGMTSLLMSDLFQEVYSFEPAPSTFKILQKNIDANKLKNINAFNFGLGDRAFASEIQYSDGNRSGGFITDKSEGTKVNKTEQVKIEKGDRLLKDVNCHPSFIKIDVEGYELNALRGLNETIKKNQPVVMVEANH